MTNFNRYVSIAPKLWLHTSGDPSRLASKKLVPLFPGEFFKLEFPNADLFVIAVVLRSMNQKERDNLVSKCFQDLKPGPILSV